MRAANLIESKINKRRRGIKVYWWRPEDRKKRNFGDEITPIFIEKLFGEKCLWTRLADCDMVGAGSVLEVVKNHNPRHHKLRVWGSGFIDKGPKLNNVDVTFDLVRGPLTNERVSNRDIIPQGDPGLLASMVLERSESVKYKLGIVVHMKDLHDVNMQDWTDNVLIISPYQTPAKVAKDITSCEMVVSSSLHGLIFADSFEVPNFRLKHNTLEGGDYKFNDYYQSTGRVMRSLTLADVEVLADSPDSYTKTKKSYKPVKDLQKIQGTIITAFPFVKETARR